MLSARWLVALALTTGGLTAHAEDLALPDGSRWTLDGTTLRRGGMSATLQVHTVGITCAVGLTGAPRINPTYLPPRFIVREEVDGGSTRATACIDGGGAAVVVTVRWPGTLAGADRASVRTLLDYFGQAAAGGKSVTPSALALFKPALVQVPLTATTGVWDFVIDATTAISTVLVLRWPETTALLKLDRTAVAQRCDSVGFTGARPAWAPAQFAPLGAIRDGMSIACFDGPDGHLLLVTGAAAASADAQARTRAVLEAIATSLGSLPAPAVASAPPPEVAPPTSADVPVADAPPPIVDAPPPSAYTPPRRSLASYLHGFSVAAHQLSPSTAGLEDGYGAALEYRRTIPRRGTLIPRVTVQGGYDNLSKWMADAQFALGARTGDWDYGLAFHAAVGFDGIGLGEDAATAGPVYIPGDVYYGGQLALDASGITAALGYYVRNADAIDSEWRLELGYALAPGRRLIGRYTTYATAGSQLSLGLAF